MTDAPERFEEVLYSGLEGQGYSQSFEITRVLHREQSGQHELIIFETPMFGRVLALDGIIQTTERDEFAYHEMLVHPGVMAHGGVARALIVGGGDGGVLREMVKHSGIGEIELVDIDRKVIELSKTHLPFLSGGSFDDPRVSVTIADGREFMARGPGPYDFIIVDSTDPVGPGESLFEAAFYRDCKAALAPGGLMITQSGVPFTQGPELERCQERLARHFMDVRFYLTVVPTYIGGFMALGWASDDGSLGRIEAGELERRWNAAGMATRYYSPAMHAAAFALPPFIMEKLG